MPLAFVSTRATRHRTRLNHRAENCELRGRLPDQDASGGDADVAAVEAKTDAAHQLPYIRLCQTRISASRASRRAIQAFRYAASERLRIKARRLRMRFDHISSC